jgi:hypothetical protein
MDAKPRLPVQAGKSYAAPAMPSLKNALTRDALVALAGPKYFARGQDYFARDLVEIVLQTDANVVAKVYGTHTYLAEITAGPEGLEVDCTCPAIEDWGPCKHVVAAGLAAIAAAGPTHPDACRLPLKAPARGVEPGAVDARFPALARWVLEGRVEVGPFGYAGPCIRVLDGDGATVWSGERNYPGLGEALADAERAVRAMVEARA